MMLVHLMFVVAVVVVLRCCRLVVVQHVRSGAAAVATARREGRARLFSRISDNAAVVHVSVVLRARRVSSVVQGFFTRRIYRERALHTQKYGQLLVVVSSYNLTH